MEGKILDNYSLLDVAICVSRPIKLQDTLINICGRNQIIS